MTKDKDPTEFEVPQVKARKNLRVGNLPKETIKALEESSGFWVANRDYLEEIEKSFD